MDELSTRCQRQLATFRIKELKDVLARIGSAKHGKKQVLLDKIMSTILYTEKEHPEYKGFKHEGISNRHVVSREEVAKVIDDIYRKMHGSGASDLASKARNVPTASKSYDQDEMGESKTRCPCGSALDLGTMIKCDNSRCGVWQHLNCVVIPEKDEMQPEVPNQFYCEICRAQRGDPFSVALSHPLLPTKLTTTSMFNSDGSSPLQTLEKSFMLSRSDRELLYKPNHDLQVWCILLNDKVPFRMHWPAYADLRVNGVSVRVTNRPGQQLLGANGRDDGPGIIACTREGANRISFSAYDARIFCVGIRIIHRLTVQQVLNMLPRQSEGEPFSDALARVCRCINGAGLGNDDGSDSDIEVVSESVTVNLRCPMSGSRIKIAGRFRPCVHMGCFDLHTFVELNQRTRKWQCPICMKNYSLNDLIIDPFMNRITTALKDYGDDLTEVEMKPDGHWRPKLEGDAKFHEPWNPPDYSVNKARAQAPVGQSVVSKPVKVEEGFAAEHMPLKIGMKRRRDGVWVVNGINRYGSAGNTTGDRISLYRKGLISRSSSATASNDEDHSVNQEASNYLDRTRRDEVEADSRLTDSRLTGGHSNWQANGSMNAEPELVNASEVIVLSDTEEDNVENFNNFNIGLSAVSGHGVPTAGRSAIPTMNSRTIATHEARNATNDVELITGTGDVLQSHTDNIGRFTTFDVQPRDIDPDLNFLGTTGTDLPFGLDNNYWGSQSETPFEFFGSTQGVPNATTDHRHQIADPAVVSAVAASRHGIPVNHTSGTGFVDYSGSLATSDLFLPPECNGGARERGLPSEDPSLRLFLPDQPARPSAQAAVNEPPEPSCRGIQEDWFSLSLGGAEPGPSNLPLAHNTTTHIEEREQLDSLDTASVLLGMSGTVNEFTAPKSTNVQNSPPRFSWHRPTQRSRHYFRVDSDSE